MRRSLLAISIFSLLSATSLFASSAQSDLLSKATDGAITTAKAESVKVLSNDEMGEVVGGAWHHDSAGDTLVRNQGVIVYKQVYGTLDSYEQYQGKPTRVYGRYMVSNGSSSAWVTYYNNGVWSQPYNTTSIRLTQLYRNEAIATARNLPNWLFK